MSQESWEHESGAGCAHAKQLEVLTVVHKSKAVASSFLMQTFPSYSGLQWQERIVVTKVTKVKWNVNYHGKSHEGAYQGCPAAHFDFPRQ